MPLLSHDGDFVRGSYVSSSGGRWREEADDFNDREVKKKADRGNAANLDPSDRYGSR
jgi:hypothetical protein